MKKEKQISANYLDFVPSHNKRFPYEIDEEGNVTIFVENKGLFHKIAQLMFKKPKVSQVHLDEMGNYIWPLIDGTRSIMDISVLVKAHFGDACEPLYNRLVQYMRNLESYEFILLEKHN